jgi:hypothetical protein
MGVGGVMSSSLRLTPDQLRDLAAFLAAVSRATSDEIRLDADGLAVMVDGQRLEITWDGAAREYVVDDLIGGL